MNSAIRKSKKKTAFTIVELLTVMSIIVILFSLLVPSLTMVRRYAKRVKQNAQFHSIAAAMQVFNDDFEGYPPSDDPNDDYPGAMKLAEAMVGQDLLGFHPISTFKSNDTDLYPDKLILTDPVDRKNLKDRNGPYLPLEGANVSTLMGLYGSGTTFGKLGGSDPNKGIVLCDEYPRTRNGLTGKRMGMPILYYKANTSKIKHDDATPNENIYDHRHNIKLIDLGLPWDDGTAGSFDHAIATVGGKTPDGDSTDPLLFYDKIQNEKITSFPRPHNPDEYILISAGFDGIYGTRDDIFNYSD